VKVVILCGGQGTRLREETEFRPKPLVDIGGRPVLWHIMKFYAHFGFKEFVLCLGYRGQMIKEYFLNYEAMNSDFTIGLGTTHSVEYHDLHGEQDYKVTLLDTGLETATGGRVQRTKPYVKDDLVLVTYGDGLIDIDLKAAIAFHKKHGKKATVTTVRPTSRFGIVELGAGNNVERFLEKPKVEGWASAGYFIFNRSIYDYLTGDGCILEREPLERLAKEGQLMAYQHEGFFFAMDTYREYLQINDIWNAGKAPWKVWK
jgi:glucose-1-phosphate cytidylyltransferase